MAAVAISTDQIVRLLGSWQERRHSRHRALATAIDDLAAQGVLPAGGRLPAERTLAAGLGVSRGTVVAAYDALVSREIVVRRHGSGTYLRNRPSGSGPPSTEISATSLLERWLMHPDGVIDLTMTVVPTPDDLPPYDLSAAQLLDVVPSHGYAFDGLPSMRRAAAAHLARQGASAEAHEIVITNGAQQAIALAASCLLRPGDLVVVEAPTYPGAIALFTRAGARIVTVATDEAGVRPDALDAVLRQEQPSLVYLMPTAHNPLGTVLPAGRREEVLRLTAGVPVLEDLTQADIWYGERPPPPPLGAGNDAHVVVIGSASKVLWGGLRIGWLRARGQLFTRLSAAKAAHDFATSVPSQVLAAELLHGVDDPWLARRRAHFDGQRVAFGSMLRRAVPAWRWREPDGGLGLWVDLGSVDAERYVAVAARHGVAVVPSTIAGPRSADRHHLRLAFSLPLPMLADAVERLALAWDALDSGAVGTPFVPTPV
jgi:DNA-binding transcriptional MocR family regulator